MGPLIMMTWLSTTWANGIASARRVNEVLDTIPEVQDEAKAGALPAKMPRRAWNSGTSTFTTTAAPITRC